MRIIKITFLTLIAMALAISLLNAMEDLEAAAEESTEQDVTRVAKKPAVQRTIIKQPVTRIALTPTTALDAQIEQKTKQLQSIITEARGAKKLSAAAKAAYTAQMDSLVKELKELENSKAQAVYAEREQIEKEANKVFNPPTEYVPLPRVRSKPVAGAPSSKYFDAPTDPGQADAALIYRQSQEAPRFVEEAPPPAGSVRNFNPPTKQPSATASYQDYTLSNPYIYEKQ